jgi:type IV pilus assembly protein PilX
MVMCNMNRKRRTELSGNHQNGAILIVSILFLLIMSIVGLKLSMRSSLDVHIATNLVLRTIAFENAESALSEASSVVTGISATIDSSSTRFDCTGLGDGYYSAATNSSNCSVLDLESINWDSSGSRLHTVVEGARYIVEYLGVDAIETPDNDVETGINGTNNTDVHVYRILGRGIAADGTAEVILQSTMSVTKS